VTAELVERAYGRCRTSANAFWCDTHRSAWSGPWAQRWCDRVTQAPCPAHNPPHPPNSPGVTVAHDCWLTAGHTGPHTCGDCNHQWENL
jgi:hypothetical protein